MVQYHVSKILVNKNASSHGGWGHKTINYSGQQTHSLIRRFKNFMDFFH